MPAVPKTPAKQQVQFQNQPTVIPPSASAPAVISNVPAAQDVTPNAKAAAVPNFSTAPNIPTVPNVSTIPAAPTVPSVEIAPNPTPRVEGDRRDPF
jgi:hypothetical protein